MSLSNLAHWSMPVLLLAMLPWTAGCPSLEALPTQAPIVELKSPESKRPYLLYVPSVYNESRSWPLVVLCHGTWPYDTAELQMREWASFAESRGILLVAPTLEAARGDLPPPPDRQIALQRKDERVVLAIVSELKRRYQIAEHLVFMTGWSAGAYDILHIGLRHPDVFRALFIRQGTFDLRFLDLPEGCIDPWQSIKVIYGEGDVLLRDQSKAMIAWLREQGAHVEEEGITGTHQRINPGLAWKYFKLVAEKRLWARIRTTMPDPDAPLTYRFELDAVPPAVKRKWHFGDGEESYDERPVHTYARPGRYELTVSMALSNGKRFVRKRVINVGQAAP